jgi:hypothetical protein
MFIAIANAIGIAKNNNNVNKLIAMFQARGASVPNSVFEAASCLKATLNELNLTYIPALLTSPQISGGDYVGALITATTGTYDGISPFTYTYQWYLDDEIIVGATGSTYTTDDQGVLKCFVSAFNDFGVNSNFTNSINITIVDSFIARVEADGGVFEAEACLISQIDNLL